MELHISGYIPSTSFIDWIHTIILMLWNKQGSSAFKCPKVSNENLPFLYK